MKNKSHLAASMIQRYVLTLLGLGFLGIGLPFVLKLVLSMRTWYETDTFYPLLAFANEHLTQLLIVTAIALWVLVTYLFVRRAIAYLDEAITATKQIVETPERSIQLSADLLELESEMNRIRENALHHQRAAKEAEQKKNDLIVYLAHDLRTPLTSIIGYLTLLEESPDLPLPQRAKYLGITLDKAYRLESLINEFFEITRFNLSKISLTTQSTDLSMMLQQITYEFNPILQEKNLTWDLTLAENIHAEVDQEKFERVLDNLIRNAVNYSEANSPIRVTLEQSGRQIYLTFENQGNTIPEDKMKRIFEPFFRADSSRTSTTGGTGLGLPIAKQLVEAHGGTLTAESEQHVFRLLLTLPAEADSSE